MDQEHDDYELSPPDRQTLGSLIDAFILAIVFIVLVPLLVFVAASILIQS